MSGIQQRTKIHFIAALLAHAIADVDFNSHKVFGYKEHAGICIKHALLYRIRTESGICKMFQSTCRHARVHTIARPPKTKTILLGYRSVVVDPFNKKDGVK